MRAAKRLGQGELEALVLDVLWAHDDYVSPADVHDALAAEGHDLAYTTVTTILVRLANKDLVERRPAGRGFTYRTTVDRDELVARRLQAILDATTDRRAALAHFVETMDGPDRAALRRALTRRSRGRPR